MIETTPATSPDVVGARRRRRWPWVLGAVPVLLLGAWGVGYLLVSDTVPRGTTVLGVPIGGRSVTAAEAAVTAGLGQRVSAPIELRAEDKRLTVDPAEAGLRLDAAATARSASGKSWNPVSIVRGLLGDGGPVDPVVDVDDDALREAVDALAQRVDRAPVEGDIGFAGGQPVPVRALAGLELDRERAREVLRSAYLREGPADLPVDTADPRITDAEVTRALDEVARPAVAAPVSVVAPVVAGAAVPRSVTLIPAVYGPALAMTPKGGRLELEVDAATLDKVTARALAAFERPPRDATFRVVDGRPVLVPAVVGTQVPTDQLAQVLLDVLPQAAPRRVTVTLTTAQPALSTAAARALGIRERISTFTTFYPTGFEPRIINIHTAADYMDGTLLRPGETFSLNAAVGERTKARGFAQGYIINRGRLEVDYGGGVSQLATTTWNAAFFAGLDEVEHHPHSFYISRYPEGREATVAWGSKDLRFRNDSGHGVFIDTRYTRGSVTVTMYGTKVWGVRALKSPRRDIVPFKTKYDPRPAGVTANSCVKQDGVVGFRVTVTRVFGRGGAEVRRESFTTRYNPEDRIICGRAGPPPPATD